MRVYLLGCSGNNFFDLRLQPSVWFEKNVSLKAEIFHFIETFMHWKSKYIFSISTSLKLLPNNRLRQCCHRNRFAMPRCIQLSYRINGQPRRWFDVCFLGKTLSPAIIYSIPTINKSLNFVVWIVKFTLTNNTTHCGLYFPFSNFYCRSLSPLK